MWWGLCSEVGRIKVRCDVDRAASCARGRGIEGALVMRTSHGSASASDARRS